MSVLTCSNQSVYTCFYKVGVIKVFPNTLRFLHYALINKDVVEICFEYNDPVNALRQRFMKIATRKTTTFYGHK